MINIIFTIDYEIYGDGSGSVQQHVLAPASRLMDIFLEAGCRMVLFVEAAEFEAMDKTSAYPEIEEVKRQLRTFHEKGFEIGYHLHPQWFGATLTDTSWNLDYKYYNLCLHPKAEIRKLVFRGISYLKEMLADPSFSPISYRAGNWLLQPTEAMAEVLREAGVLIDSSVFKGGLQRALGLDYRPAVRNGYYWRFHEDVNTPTTSGILVEIPIYTELVPAWRMIKPKRLKIHKTKKKSNVSKGMTAKARFTRLMDLLRFRYPLKFDFCRMTLKELTSLVENIIKEDYEDPATFRPIVAIGHTKDLSDFGTVELFLTYLKEKQITVSTFKDILHRL